MRIQLLWLLACMVVPAQGRAQPAVPRSAASIAPASAPPAAVATSAKASPTTTAPPTVAFAPDAVIALLHRDNPAKVIMRADLAAMLLGQRRIWSHGPGVIALRRATGTKTRTHVNDKVLRMSASSYRQYWQRRELAGKGIAPRTASPGQILRVVTGEPGAVGCITGAEATRLPKSATVRVVEVTFEE